MSLTYWPNADYAETQNSIKRLNTSTGFASFDAALSKLNSWGRDINLLWAWIDIKDGRKKIEKVQLVKTNEGLWSGSPTTLPDPATPTDVSAADVTSADASTTLPDRADEPVDEPSAPEAEVGAPRRQLKRYDTATKLAMVERIKAEGIILVAANFFLSDRIAYRDDMVTVEGERRIWIVERLIHIIMMIALSCRHTFLLSVCAAYVAIEFVAVLISRWREKGITIISRIWTAIVYGVLLVCLV